MLDPGLVSITFRQLAPQDVVQLVTQAGLSGIEWGGDIHVPHGDVRSAQDVATLTQNAGLHVAAYGSYYRVGHEETGPFEAVLSSAVALGAPSIRVWAGKVASADADEAYWQAVIADARRIADLAAMACVAIAFEFHANTLTDTTDAAVRLLAEVEHPNVWSYWQPPRYSQRQLNLAALNAIANRLSHIHVFSWHATSGERMALADGAADWHAYLACIAANVHPHPGERRYAMIEFVKENAPEQFLRDAATLKEWLAPDQ